MNNSLDSLWRGVNMRAEPHTLEPGWASDGINLRFRSVIPETRLGSVLLPWLNKIVSGASQPWGTIYGVGVFRDPTTNLEHFLIAADGSLYYSRANTAALPVTLPAGVTISTPVTFEQVFDAVLMFRGPDLAPLVMTSILAGFTDIPQANTWSVTPDYTTSRFTLEAHNFLPYDLVRFTGATLPAGLVAGTNYYVVSMPTVDLFTVSATPGGAEVAFTSNGDSVSVTAFDGALEIPRSLRSTKAANRLFVIRGAHNVAASDPLDYARYQIYNEFRIEEGSDDVLVQIAMFGDKTMICLEGKSVHRVDNVTGDLASMTRSLVTRRYGIVAPLSAVDCGTDFLWLSQEGVSSLALTEFGEVQAGQGALAQKPPQFSEDIQPLIDRINWKYASGAVAALWHNAYYLFVPLDDAEMFSGGTSSFNGSATVEVLAIANVIAGATYRYTQGSSSSLTNGTETIEAGGTFTAQTTEVTLNFPLGGVIAGSITRVFMGVNNACLRYDFQTRAWSGLDQSDNMCVKFVQFVTYQNRQRLVTIGADGWVRLWEEDYEEQLSAGATEPVTATFISRGYTAPAGDLSIARWLDVDLQTWHPRYTISILPDGVGEEIVLRAGVTKSRTVYDRPFDRPAWDPTNVNADFLAPHRQDYSVAPGSTGITEGGVIGNLHQESREPLHLSVPGRAVRVKIVNDQGRFRLVGLSLNQSPKERRNQ